MNARNLGAALGSPAYMFGSEVAILENLFLTRQKSPTGQNANRATLAKNSNRVRVELTWPG